MNNGRYAIFIALAIIIVCVGAKSHSWPMQKPYTIMIYMNGSDLESDFGLATDDLAEMLDSGLKSQNANVIILTGGTNRWMNDAIPEYECIIWELSDGWLNELESIGNADMGNPATLRDFIKFGLENYPAQKYGLIMWDHGGGSIAGFGHDENFNDSSLSLADMKQAFEEAGLGGQKLEFLGFDACLMATIEMAILAADYAKVLIASEDLEPGEGWDYHFLGQLNKRPWMNGFELGKVIVDTFIDFFGKDSDEILTLSVVDLSLVDPVMEAMGALMAAAHSEIETDGFHTLAHRRAITKTFGEGSPRDNYADMVDIGDMAVQLYDLFPQQAEAVLLALENCVVYNRHNSDVDLWGLSTFYIYGGKSQGVPSLATYAALDMDKNYTMYLHEFFDNLKHGEPAPIIHTELVLWQQLRNTDRMVGLLQTSDSNADLLWPNINGHPVVLFSIATTTIARKYAIPAKINSVDVDIIVSFSSCNPQGRIIGSRNIGERVFQKGYDPILLGDKIAIYYIEYDFASDSEIWARGDVFTVRDDLQLAWAPAGINHRQGLRLTDARNNVTYVFL